MIDKMFNNVLQCRTMERMMEDSIPTAFTETLDRYLNPLEYED